ARLVGAARGQVIFALAPFVGAVLAWPVNGERVRVSTAVAFVTSLVGVLVVATSRHGHVHTHEPVEHAHPIDPLDPHHTASSIELVSGNRHRHLALRHDHAHLPDIHHRHVH
ncbi:MAG: DMT family transporter, partial [Actinobacteria bacterium]|nr:DMT family transporter [Actinomycetota bacterium]